jgi:tight adherence protein B
LSLANLALLCAGGAVGAGAAALVLTHDAFKSALIGVFAGTVLPLFVLRRLRNRRRAKFTEQLPEALDLIVRSLRAGHPVAASIKLTAREFRDPLGSEFGMIDDEITYGLDLETALRNMLDRVGQEDLPLFAASVAIQASSGGNLTDILSNLCEVIRARVKMRRKIRALSSEGRASAMILSSVPIVLFMLINWISPDFYRAHWSDPLMTRGLLGAAIWMGIGNLVMRRMINFKF